MSSIRWFNSIQLYSGKQQPEVTFQLDYCLFIENTLNPK